jgi:FMN phosphatase YigB (HAD superfamily)
MISLHSQTTTWFDVDDTLLSWNATDEQVEKHGILFTCPAGKNLIDGEVVDSPSWTERLVPHRKHIEQLKKHKSRHSLIIVWSAAGSDWAETVVKTLGLEQYVDLCISKPTWVYDDLPVQEFMPKSKWMKDE